MSRYKYHLSRLRSDKYTLPALARWEGGGDNYPLQGVGACVTCLVAQLRLTAPVNLLEQTIERVKPHATSEQTVWHTELLHESLNIGNYESLPVRFRETMFDVGAWHSDVWCVTDAASCVIIVVLRPIWAWLSCRDMSNTPLTDVTQFTMKNDLGRSKFYWDLLILSPRTV